MNAQASSVLLHGDQAELLQRDQRAFLAKFFRDLAILDAEDGRPREADRLPDAAGRLPTGRSLNAGPVCVPQPSERPTT